MPTIHIDQPKLSVAARNLKSFLANEGVTQLGHIKCLEALAAAFGYNALAALQAEIKSEAESRQATGTPPADEAPLTDPRQGWLATVEHHHGTDVFTASTFGGLMRGLANYCLDNWYDLPQDKQLEDSDFPFLTDEEIVSYYFDHIEGEYMDVSQDPELAALDAKLAGRSDLGPAPSRNLPDGPDYPNWGDVSADFGWLDENSDPWVLARHRGSRRLIALVWRGGHVEIRSDDVYLSNMQRADRHPNPEHYQGDFGKAYTAIQQRLDQVRDAEVDLVFDLLALGDAAPIAWSLKERSRAKDA